MITDKCPTCKRELTFQTKSGHYKFVKYKRQCKSCSKRVNHSPSDYIRQCSECKSPMVYKTISEKNRSDRENRICKSCAATIYNGFTGKSHSDSVKEHLSKIRIGKPLSEITKEKLRIITINWLDSIGARGIGCKFYNKNACRYFDSLNSRNKWNLQHAESGGEHVIAGYSVDAYDTAKNIVVEYDEPRHYDKDDNLKPKDVLRMNRIIKSCGCRFFRYNEKQKTLTEYFLT